MITLIKKIKGVINKKVLRTPGVEYLLSQGDNIETKKKHINTLEHIDKINENIQYILNSGEKIKNINFLYYFGTSIFYHL